MQTSKRVPNKRLLSRIFAAFLISAVLPIQFLAQNFANPDLNGTVFSYSTIPASWQKVDATDPACLATNPNLSDTPDLCNLTEPGIANGVGGFAFSGNTFVSGLIQDNGTTGTIFHEGLQQTVNGLTIGESYSIVFNQSVVKQVFALDQSGSWSVYMDNLLLGTTAQSTSTLNFDDPALIWEERSVSFSPTATSHTFKFLPTDDDPDIGTSTTNILGSLRMGIDNINIEIGNDCSLDLGPDLDLCIDALPVALTSNLIGTYLWNTGATSQSIVVSDSGTYSVEVTAPCGTLSDSVSISVSSPIPPIDLGVDIELCPQDFPISIGTDSQGDIIWNTFETTDSISIFTPGEYSVVASNICGFESDAIMITEGLANPIFSLGNDIEACIDDFPIQLDAGVTSNITWDSGDTTQIVFAPTPGIYSATVSNNCGSTIDDIEITLINAPAPITLGPDIIVCENEFPVSIVLAEVDDVILWSNGSNGQEITANNEGIYDVTVSNLCGSSFADILVTSQPNQLEEESVVICQGESELFLGINYSEEGTYDVIVPGVNPEDCDVFWTVNVEVIPTDTIFTYLEIAEGETINFQGNFFDEAGDYILIEELEDECNKIIDLKIDVKDEIYVYVPNAFTPGDDELNPLFKPVITVVGDINLSEFEFEIYDRFGQIVFETEDSETIGWNGSSYNNSEYYVQDGIYTWRLKYSSEGNADTEELLGSVLILR